jgi:hypothetical protein
VNADWQAVDAKRRYDLTAQPLGTKGSRVVIGVAISALVAIGIAVLVHVVLFPPEPKYSIDASSVALTASDVGSGLTLVSDGDAGPSQRPREPLPYQQQFHSGTDRYFMTQSALVAPGKTEIETYQQAHGFPPTIVPTIFGPFVADHQGLFEVDDQELSYHTASSAHPDYMCCDNGGTDISNFTANYDNWRTYPVHLGDEGNAGGGIRHSFTNPPQEYEEQVFRIRWRHGPIVSTLFLRGAHDLTFDAGMRLAQIVDARISSALQQGK